MNETNAIVPTAGYAIIGTHLVVDFLLLLMLVQYHRRRRFQPIRSRLYWQGEITAVLVMMATFYAACVSEFHNYVTCEVLSFMFVVFLNAAFPVVIRAAHVFTAYEVSRIYAKGGSSNQEQKSMKNGNFFLRRAEILQNVKFQAAAFCTFATFTVAVFLVFIFGFAPTCDSWDIVIVLVMLGSGLTGPTLYMGWNMATLKDGLYIKRELILVPVGGFLFLPTYVGLRLAYGDFLYANMVAAFAPLWVPIVQIGMPLYKSYVWQRYRNLTELEEPSQEMSLTGYRTEEKKSRGGSFIIEVSKEEETKRHFRGPSSLMKVLDSKSGNALLLEFARLELNHENILFYNEVTGFLEECKENPELVEYEEFEDRCWKIFHRFISAHARLELNLGAKERAYFDNAGFDENEGHLDNSKALLALKIAWTESINLMYRDCFPRFIRSKGYEQFQEEIVIMAV